MSKLLEFKGTWRVYQERVLRNADQYLENDKIHIVAAPGSGKTTLGIELMGRIDQPTLVLVPSITIREQWISRIKDVFLKEGTVAEEILSNNLKNPKYITVATYQALHSAMTKMSAKNLNRIEAADEEADEDKTIENETDRISTIDEIEEMEEALDCETQADLEETKIDYSDFELVKVMKAANLGTICLDECHHLRSEWWKALENFKGSFKDTKVIALTATPPYDSTPAMWKRYIDVCGEIDEEITIPELVKDGCLCPHQDYVYFNYPTKEETREIETFRQNSKVMLNRLMEDSSLTEIVKSHKGLIGEKTDDALLENPGYLSSILIYLQEKKCAYPKRLLKLLGVKKLPCMDEKWMEQLLQGLLYDDKDSYLCDKVYQEQLMRDLKAAGLLEKRKVCMAVNTGLEKMLISSKGKIESIKEITAHEYASLGKDLRLLILTDYVRKACIKDLGNKSADMNQLGVLPFFELLRREAVTGLRLGVLCGSVVIIPAEAKEQLLSITGKEKILFSHAGSLSEDDYIQVEAVGNAHFLTAAVTELFEQGYMQVLIGTKSLLGEGWDAPCVNSLILASFVGSFMLSNQMRGRAIRIDQKRPDKTSNIWHLVCITLPKYVQDGDKNIDGEDFLMLERRMEHFMGLHYEEDSIENGAGRLSIIRPPYTKAHIENINREMLMKSDERNQLRERWDKSLAISNGVSVVDEVDISERYITIALFYDALRDAAMSIVAIGIYLWLTLARYIGNLGLIGILIHLVLLGIFGFSIRKALMLGTPLRRLKAIGNGIRKAMLQLGTLSTEHCKIESDSFANLFYSIYLDGASGKEKKDFAYCVLQFFTGIDNQRYILVNKHRKNKLDGFFAVPDSFSKNKEDAQLFADCMKPYIGKYDLVYTRSEEGRKILLEGRVKALANREERCVKKQKVKSALE